MQEESQETEFYSLAQAALYAKVCRQAVYVAILKGQLKAEKRYIPRGHGPGNYQWVIAKKDLEDYRANKYNREKRIVDGQKLFDIADDRWSVLHAAKTLSSALGREYKTARLYYLLRTGRLRASKKGNAWVISKQSMIDIYNEEIGTNSSQIERQS